MRQKRHKKRVASRTCGVKRVFSTVSEAFDNVIRIVWEEGDASLMAYKCPFCDGYHIGHEKVRNGLPFRPFPFKA